MTFIIPCESNVCKGKKVRLAGDSVFCPRCGMNLKDLGINIKELMEKMEKYRVEVKKIELQRSGYYRNFLIWTWLQAGIICGLFLYIAAEKNSIPTLIVGLLFPLVLIIFYCNELDKKLEKKFPFPEKPF